MITEAQYDLAYTIGRDAAQAEPIDNAGNGWDWFVDNVNTEAFDKALTAVDEKFPDNDANAIEVSDAVYCGVSAGYRTLQHMAYEDCEDDREHDPRAWYESN